MPAGRQGDASGSNAGNPAQRTNFRPPWVKETPPAIPMPTAPWTLANRNKEMQQNKNSEPEQKGPTARKTSTVKIVPVQPAENGAYKDPHTFQVPKLRETPKTETKLQSREIKVPITLTSRQKEPPPVTTHLDNKKDEKPEVKQVPIQRETNKREPPKKEEVKQIPVQKEPPKNAKEMPINKEKREEVKEIPVKREMKTEPPKKEPPKKEVKITNKEEVKKFSPEPEIDKAIPEQRNKMVRQASLKKLQEQIAPAPPPMPPTAPPPPPPPMLPNKNLTQKQLEKIEALKARPKKRPDWTQMMKQIELGTKLKKVECNDRSKPLLPKNKAKGQFIYDSEKPNLHNQLLKQIQMGAPLKHVKCNDRSKPILEGLRKFRRQLTIEEQIQKSQSIANMSEADVEEELLDEMDDIDKVRDDLQSTKQMLALELRNKEAQIRENKRLQAKILQLEQELEEERAKKAQNPETVTNNVTTTNGIVDDKVVQTLKEEIKETKKQAEELEKKFHDTEDQLATTKFELEEAKRQNSYLEKRVAAMAQEGGLKRPISEKNIPLNKQGQQQEPESETEEELESESSSEEEGEDEEAKAIKRTEREIRLLGNKLRSYKNKEEAARRERKSLRDQMKKLQQAIKEEKKKYKELQREVNKMAALMRDEDDEDADEEEEKEEAEEECEEEEEESESESESESSEEESSEEEEEDKDLPLDKKKEKLQTSAKRHENCLNALKKGNYMLKANVDRLQDDLNKQKEEVITLQEDLDSVLAELG